MMIDKQHPQQPAMANDVIEFTDAIHLYYMKKLEIQLWKVINTSATNSKNWCMTLKW